MKTFIKPVSLLEKNSSQRYLSEDGLKILWEKIKKLVSFGNIGNIKNPVYFENNTPKQVSYTPDKVLITSASGNIEESSASSTDLLKLSDVEYIPKITVDTINLTLNIE